MWKLIIEKEKSNYFYTWESTFITFENDTSVTFIKR